VRKSLVVPAQAGTHNPCRGFWNGRLSISLEKLVVMGPGLRRDDQLV
jgi:hypothetical protein